MLESQRPNGRIRIVGVLVAVVLGTALGVWHNRRERAGLTDPVTAAVGVVTTPIVRGMVSAKRWVSRQTGWLVRGRFADEENRRLREEVRRLREENAALQEAAATAQRLRKQLGFPQTPPAPKLAADVIAYRPDPMFDTMVIARGARDGVRVGSVVLAPEGLVGSVYAVGPTSASVMLLTDTNAAVGAMVRRPESRATGVARGEGDGTMALLYVPRDADVRVGDAITSSGLGGNEGIYPKGLPIGTVIAVGDPGASATRPIRIRPFAPFGRLEEVYVLR